jgi:mono/diheme cytochrome c family protein
MSWPLSLLRVGAVAVAGGLLATSVSGCFSNKQNEGAKLYQTHCSSCHGEQGEGLRRLIPPVAASDYLVKHRKELPCLIRQGLNGPIVVNGIEYNQVMPGHKTDLTDADIANLLNFIQQNWGNHNPPYTVREISELLAPCNGSIIR